MHFQFLTAFLFVCGAYSLEYSTLTGPTPPPCDPEAGFCAGRADGNYPYKDTGGVADTHVFIQCSNGMAYCQPCWPIILFFSPECNQCLYNIDDPCYTTLTWTSKAPVPCPDLCPAKGPNFRGNIADPNDGKHYVGCWDGITMGCVHCPFPLLFNEDWNACLYNGIHHTAPAG